MAESTADVPSVVDTSSSSKRPLEGEQSEAVATSQQILPGDSAVTRAEKSEGNGINGHDAVVGSEEPVAKRVKLDDTNQQEAPKADARDRVKGLAMVKEE
jgi:tRNA-dihydrouridine synthase 3